LFFDFTLIHPANVCLLCRLLSRNSVFSRYIDFLKGAVDGRQLAGNPFGAFPPGGRQALQ